MTRILVVEDSEDMAFGLRNNLEFEGYEVDVAADGPAGLTRAEEGRADLMILDLTLPGMDGLDLLKSLRARGNAIPILVLTARQEEIDKVEGLKLGADDYVTKPFGVMELLARVEALLRRSEQMQPMKVFRMGDIEVNVSARTVLRQGQPVELAPRELDLLLSLIAHQGRVVTREELLREVWGHAGRVVTRTVDTHVAELRRKLEPDATNPIFILTARKAGYRFDMDQLTELVP